MADQTQRTYRLCAIDRTSRWVDAEIFEEKSAASAQRFLCHLIEKAPFAIPHDLIDNGKVFTDRFIATGSRRPQAITPWINSVTPTVSTTACSHHVTPKPT